jgi:hypothetical protein
VYYPPDSNCLLSVFDHCLRSRNYVNIVTCGKQPQLQWLNMDEALEHCSRGASTWKFATNDEAESRMLYWPAPAMCQPLRSARRRGFAEACARHQGARRQCSGLDDSDVS